MQRRQKGLYSRLDSWLTDPTWLRVILFTVMAIFGAGVCFVRAFWWWFLIWVLTGILGLKPVPFAIIAIWSVGYDIATTDIIKLKQQRGWKVPDEVLHRLTWGMWGLSSGVIILLIIAGV